MHALPDRGMNNAQNPRPDPHVPPQITRNRIGTPADHLPWTRHQGKRQECESRIRSSEARAAQYVLVRTCGIKHRDAHCRKEQERSVVPRQASKEARAPGRNEGRADRQHTHRLEIFRRRTRLEVNSITNRCAIAESIRASAVIVAGASTYTTVLAMRDFTLLRISRRRSERC